MCSHTHAHTHTLTWCLLRSCSHPDSLAAAESRGLIGRAPCNGRFDWLSGWLPPCQLREHVCLCVCCVCVLCVRSVFVVVAADNQSQCPAVTSAFLCIHLFFSFLNVGTFFIFSDLVHSTITHRLEAQFMCLLKSNNAKYIFVCESTGSQHVAWGSPGGPKSNQRWQKIMKEYKRKEVS